MLRLSRTTPRGASAPRMVEIPVVAGASVPSSGSCSKGTPAAIEGDDASPRDPAPTTRDDAPAVVDPTGAGAERAGGAGGLGGPGGALPTPIDDHRHARGPGVVPPDPSRLSLDDTDPTTAPAISETYPVAAPAAASGPHPPSPKPPWRWHPSRRRPDETDADPRWLARRKHFFILSDAGKPIYSRYGDVASLAGFTATLAAVAAAASATSTSTGDGDGERCSETLRSISFGARHEMVFLSRGPVYLVALASAGESPGALRRQLCLLHAQFLSTLTDAVERALRRSSRFDARQLLGGTDAAFGTLAHAFTWDPATFLGAWAPAPFPPTARRAATTACRAAIATRAAAAAGAHAALLATTHHVITLVTAARRGTVGVGQCAMDPDDALCASQFARSGESFARNPENFAPVCLPRFRSSAFAHAYVAYLEPEVVLVLVATRSDAFFALREARVALEATLRREGVLERAAKLGDEVARAGAGDAANPGDVANPGDDTNPTTNASGEETTFAAGRAGNVGGGERRPGSVCVATRVPRAAGAGPRVGGRSFTFSTRDRRWDNTSPRNGTRRWTIAPRRNDSFARTRASSRRCERPRMASGRMTGAREHRGWGRGRDRRRGFRDRCGGYGGARGVSLRRLVRGWVRGGARRDVTRGAAAAAEGTLRSD